MKKSATISDCNKYRYDLFRIWDESKGYLMFIGLNPSTADDKLDDPTICRCIGFAQNLGFGGLCMCNLFAYRATNPSELLNIENPVGEKNDYYLKLHSQNSSKIIVCWGNDGILKDRFKDVLSLINKDIYALDINKSGQPKHPLYIKAGTIPKKFSFD